jgi:hypothetical protein
MAVLKNLSKIYHEFGKDWEYISCLDHLILRAVSVDIGRYRNQELTDVMKLLKSTFASNAAAAPIITHPLVVPAA